MSLTQKIKRGLDTAQSDEGSDPNKFMAEKGNDKCLKIPRSRTWVRSYEYDYMKREMNGLR